jgi:hypothetical protein
MGSDGQLPLLHAGSAGRGDGVPAVPRGPGSRQRLRAVGHRRRNPAGLANSGRVCDRASRQMSPLQGAHPDRPRPSHAPFAGRIHVDPSTRREGDGLPPVRADPVHRAGDVRHRGVKVAVLQPDTFIMGGGMPMTAQLVRASATRLRTRRIDVSRFASWQRQMPSPTAALVRLLRLLAR